MWMGKDRQCKHEEEKEVEEAAQAAAVEVVEGQLPREGAAQAEKPGGMMACARYTGTGRRTQVDTS